MNEAITARIAEYAKKVGLTRCELADAIGLKHSTLISQLNGTRGISVDVLNKIFDTFPLLNKNWIFTGEGEMELSINGIDADSPYLVKIKELEEKVAKMEKQLIEKDAQIEVLKSLIKGGK